MNHDGFWIVPYNYLFLIDFSPQFVDWSGLITALVGRDSPASDFTIHQAFMKRLDAMKLRPAEYLMIRTAWSKARRYEHGEFSNPLCFAERMALARTARRIIREVEQTRHER